MDFHDAEAELAVLGAAILRPVTLSELSRLLDPSDFGSPVNSQLFAAALRLHDRGEPVDALTVAREAGQDAEYGRRVVSATAAAATASTALHLGEHLVDLSSRRSAYKTLTEGQRGLASGEPLPEVVDETTRALASAVAPPAESVLESLDDFASRADNDSPWVVENFLRRQNRVVVVAPSGVGKAVMIRQICWAISVGLHPFDRTRVEAQPTLIVDAENPAEAINEIARPLITWTRDRARIKDSERERCSILHRPGGMDLRSRRDRSLLESALATHRPVLCGIGPLYKLTRRRPDETAEEAAIETTQIFDDLRVRYDCAFVIEHHSPRGESLLPFGSSVWERWPEMGVTLEPVGDPRQRKVGRYRGDRIKVRWPSTLEIPGDGWPYVGHYGDRAVG